MGAPPLLHTLSGKDRLLKKTYSSLCSVFVWVGKDIANMKQSFPETKKTKKKSGKWLFIFSTTTLLNKNIALKAPNQKCVYGFAKDFSNSRRIGNNVKYNKSSLNQRGCHVFLCKQRCIINIWPYSTQISIEFTGCFFTSYCVFHMSWHKHVHEDLAAGDITSTGVGCG